MIGDIVGKPGRGIVRAKLPKLIGERGLDFVVANGENAARGSGITPNHVRELTAAGVDAITTGDHIWKQAKTPEYLRSEGCVLLRPLNYPPEAAGCGFGVFQTRNGRTVGVVNLIGRVFMMDPADCPFHAVDAVLAELSRRCDAILVDMHAEATSEKIAMGWYLDGRVTAVLGTHTHVPTADERVLPGGTAYISDVGMTGPYQSVIGREIKPVVERFTDGMFHQFTVATDDVRLSGVIVDVDEASWNATAIERVCLRAE
jgi:hypothetical protein